jgi:hypothetical protein
MTLALFQVSQITQRTINFKKYQCIQHTSSDFQTYQGAIKTEFHTRLNVEPKESFQKLPQSILGHT